MIDAIETLAGSTKPTNDSMHMFNVDVLLWWEKVADMVKGVYWEKLKPKSDYRQTWQIARKSLIWITQYGVTPVYIVKKEEGRDVRTYKWNKWPWKRLGPLTGVKIKCPVCYMGMGRFLDRLRATQRCNLS